MPTAVGTASLPPSADGESPAEVQRKTLRPERANTPAAVRVPRSAGAEKKPPVRGELADAVRVPRSAGAEKAAALSGANPPAAVRVPQLVSAGNIYKKSCCTHAAALFHAKS